MKKIVLVIAIIFTCSVAGLSQKQRNREVVLDSGTRINGQLQNSVDVNKAQVGDEVVLKTTSAITQQGRTVVPRGSRLIGKVTDVQKRSGANRQSRLGMIFDRIEGKNLTAPISASILSITNANAGGSVGDMAEADVFGSGSTSARTTSSGTGGGGVLGGVTNTVGGVLNTTTQTIGGIAEAGTQTVGSTAASAGRTLNGIRISNSVSGSAQSGTTLSSTDRNIRLEKGVNIQLMLNSSVRSDRD